MSKYGGFEVVRTERLKCKRVNDANADEEGMREYSYLKCPHCNTEDIEIASDNVYKQKYTVIRDHILICPSFAGERPPKRGKGTATTSATASTAMVVIPVKTDELAELKAEMAAFKQKVADEKEEMTRKEEEMRRKDEEKDRRLENLESKTSLYDSVLEAVMPSLVLPLTAPMENAKITLRDAAMKDIASRPLALPAPEDVISRDLHTAMMEQKDAMIEQKDLQIATEKERREEMKGVIDKYKGELEAKDSELSKTKQEKEKAEADKKEAELRAHEACKTWTSLSTRTARLQKERDALDAKYKAALKGHEQSVRNHGKHGQSMLAKLLYTEKRGYTAVTDQEADASRAIERDFARREALKRARHE